MASEMGPVMLTLTSLRVVTRLDESHCTYGQRQCAPAAEVAAVHVHAASAGGSPHACFIWRSSAVSSTCRDSRLRGGHAMVQEACY